MHRKLKVKCHAVECLHACHRNREGRRSMLLMAGWLDATAASAISAYVYTAKKPGISFRQSAGIAGPDGTSVSAVPVSGMGPSMYAFTSNLLPAMMKVSACSSHRRMATYKS